MGIRQIGDALVVPVYGADKALTGLQFIQPDGQNGSSPAPARPVAGVAQAGRIPPTDWRVILLAEGWATAASLHTATGHPVFIALTAATCPPSPGTSASNSRRPPAGLRR